MSFPHFQALLDGAMELRRQEAMQALTVASFPYVKEGDQKRVAAGLEGQGTSQTRSTPREESNGWDALRNMVAIDAIRFPGAAFKKEPPPRIALEPSPEE